MFACLGPLQGLPGASADDKGVVQLVVNLGASVIPLPRAGLVAC